MQEQVLTGKRALVTGASRGIGRAIAVALAKEGCSLSLVARTPSGLDETKKLCLAHTDKVYLNPGDLKELPSLSQTVDKAVSQLGGLDILINDAGMGARGKVGEADLKRWNELIDVNLKSLINLSHYAVNELKKNAWGAIINIASIAGKQATGGGAAYTASKHGVVGFSTALFEDVREHNIKVTAICPGYVNTSMVSSHQVDPQKMIQPDDIAKTVVFVLQCSNFACPTEIIVRPQRSPYKSL